jgi:hypothetical protein
VMLYLDGLTVVGRTTLSLVAGSILST